MKLTPEFKHEGIYPKDSEQTDITGDLTLYIYRYNNLFIISLYIIYSRFTFVLHITVDFISVHV